MTRSITSILQGQRENIFKLKSLAAFVERWNRGSTGNSIQFVCPFPITTVQNVFNFYFYMFNTFSFDFFFYKVMYVLNFNFVKEILRRIKNNSLYSESKTKNVEYYTHKSYTACKVLVIAYQWYQFEVYPMRNAKVFIMVIITMRLN